MGSAALEGSREALWAPVLVQGLVFFVEVNHSDFPAGGWLSSNSLASGGCVALHMPPPRLVEDQSRAETNHSKSRLWWEVEGGFGSSKDGVTSNRRDFNEPRTG